FFELGGDSITAAILVNRLQKGLEENVYVVALFDAPTIIGLSQYLKERYPEAIRRKFPTLGRASEKEAAAIVGENQRRAVRRAIPHLEPWKGQDGKNPGAVFILCSTGSGSTLLMEMLAEHERLFAPPELELLGFNSLCERRKAFEGHNQFYLEGALRALTQLMGCDLEGAQRRMKGGEAAGMSVKQFYGWLQGMLGERILVDKTASYSLDLKALQRAEEYFHEPRYIHLVRHPHAMIRSFERLRSEQLAFRYGQDLNRRELA